MRTWLYVDRPVCSLQCDLTIPDAGTVTIAPGISNKSLVSNRLPSGVVRVIVYGLTLDTFSGFWGWVDGDVTRVSGVVTATADGTDAGARITEIGQVSGVRIAMP